MVGMCKMGSAMGFSATDSYYVQHLTFESKLARRGLSKMYEVTSGEHRAFVIVPRTEGVLYTGVY